MTALILAKLAPYLAGLAAIIGALFWQRRAGKRDAKRETALEAAERYAKIRKAMDHAETDAGSDPAVLRDWLRERGQR